MSERAPQHTRRWALLSRLLPNWYREAYGADLLRLHVERRGDAAGAVFWWQLTGDVLLTAAQLRIDSWKSARPESGRTLRRGWDVGRQHVRLALRGLARAPGFTLAVLITLVLGIGANATIFAVLDRLLLSPPEHVVDHQGVRRLSIFGLSPFTAEEGYSSALSYPDYRDLKATRAFAHIAGHSATTMTLGQGLESQRVSAEYATASYFPLLGVRPHLGRFYTEQEDHIGTAQPAVVLSYGFWQRHFAGASNVLGRTVELGKGRYTVIGVTPRGFTGVNLAPIDVWVPMLAANAIESGTQWEDARRWYWFGAIARLSPTVNEDAALAEATAHYRAGRGAFEGKAITSRVAADPLIAARGRGPAREVRVTQALAAVALMMLLIACANVSNLFLVRGIKRRKQLAVQSALGMGRTRLLTQLMTEALVLAAAAGTLSFFAAESIGPLLFRTLLPEATPPAAGGVRVLVATFLITGAALLLTSVVPAIRASRVDLMDVLRSGKSAPRAAWLRRSLSAVQAALSVVLLVGAGLFVRSLQQARALDVGLELSTIAVSMELTNGARFGEELAPAAYAAIERVRAHPIVESATVSSIMPFFGTWGLSVQVPGPDSIDSGPKGPFFYAASGDYFKTMGIPIVRGRALTDADDAAAAQPVAVVNEAMARSVWRGADPIGKCFFVNRAEKQPVVCTTVVGVARDVLPSVTATEPLQLYYLPPRHRGIGFNAGQVLLVRARGKPEAAVPIIRDLVRSAVPNVRFVEAATLEQRVAPQLRSWRLGATLLSVFGILALLVAAAGLYSVLAFDVAQRRFELGVRSALGASAPRLVRAIASDVLLVTGAGVALGLVAALALARTTEQLLFRVQATDPIVYGAAVLALLFIALAASAFPSWRATRIDPKIALNSE